MVMSRWYYSIRLLCIAFYFLNAVDSIQPDRSTVSTPLEKLLQMEKLVKRHGPAIPLTSKQYRLLVIESPRIYNVVLLLTGGPSVQCAQCIAAGTTFSQLADAYYHEGLMRAQKDNTRVPTFFCSVDLGLYEDIATLHQITAIPMILFMDKDTLLDYSKKTKLHSATAKFIPIPSHLVLTHIPNTISFADNVIQWVNSKSGLPHIKLRKTLMDKLKFALICVIWLTVGLGVPYKLLKAAQQYPIVMALGALVIQVLACSALCWSVLHGFKWIGVDQNLKTLLFISPNRRSQFVVEGLLMSSLGKIFFTRLYVTRAVPLVMICGMAFICAGYLVNKKTKHIGIPELLIAFCLIIFACYAYATVIQIHERKTGIPSGGFWPPPQYIKGPLLHDRGNSY